jgi:hypothetical protein
MVELAVAVAVSVASSVAVAVVVAVPVALALAVACGAVAVALAVSGGCVGVAVSVAVRVAGGGSVAVRLGVVGPATVCVLVGAAVIVAVRATVLVAFGVSVGTPSMVAVALGVPGRRVGVDGAVTVTLVSLSQPERAMTLSGMTLSRTARYRDMSPPALTALPQCRSAGGCTARSFRFEAGDDLSIEALQLTGSAPYMCNPRSVRRPRRSRQSRSRGRPRWALAPPRSGRM